MISLFSPTETEKRYEIITEPFERINIIKETFDLIFTSPPYFNFETYISSDKITSITQSIMNYPIFNDWIIHFLFTSLYKCWQHLIIDGNMVIHLSDVYKTNYVEAMILFVLGWCKNSRMDGSIASIGDCAKPRPLWIFHKTIKDNDCYIWREKMKKYYPELFRLLEIYFYMV
jgi:DNA modification methylase